MTTPSNSPLPRDPATWELARRRSSFKYHLIVYVIFNIFLWALWYFTSRRYTHDVLPWPVWPTAGWGIGLLFHYLGAYVFPNDRATEREYEKLMKSKD